MSTLSLIIKREFIAKVRNKSFIVMTFLSPLLFVAMALLIGYLTSMNRESADKIAVHDEMGFLKDDFKNSKKTEYIDLSSLSLADAKEKADKEYEGLIYIPKVNDVKELSNKIEYISNDSPSMDFIGDVEDVINNKLTKNNLESLGFDYQKIEDAQAKASIRLSKFTGEESLKGINEIKIFLGSAFGYLIMMFIIIYGNLVMRSVIEEKVNRIIEIIISSVKPFQLMMGKIIGTSLAGVLQFLIWIILGVAMFIAVGSMFGLQMGSGMPAVEPGAIEVSKINIIQNYITELFTLPLGTLAISFVIYFIGGYFLYSSFYAAIGAAVDNETDSQQFLFPIMVPLILGVYVGFFTVLDNPHGTIATVFSMIPLTSPIVMLMRIPFGVPLWQLIVSVLLLFGTFLLVVWFASKIYRIGILMYGKKPTYKEIFKWLKY